MHLLSNIEGNADFSVVSDRNTHIWNLVTFRHVLFEINKYMCTCDINLKLYVHWFHVIHRVNFELFYATKCLLIAFIKHLSVERIY